MLEADGWRIVWWKRGMPLPVDEWDLLIITIGTVAPVQMWWKQDLFEWTDCVVSNLITPFRMLQSLWPKHKPDSTVIWFAGSNPQKIMPGYSAYNCSKIAVIKLIEQMDHETPDCKFIAFGPGYVKTKIHEATIEANWPNERLARGDKGTSMEDIYEALAFCIRADKNDVGGRNICVSDLGPHGYRSSERDFGKLRRVE